MRALILCAGKGTRLGKLTKNTPKPMIKIGGKPVLEHLVEHLKKYGITEIIVNLHHKPKKIMKYFGTRLLYFYEPELLGVKGTEKRLKKWLGDEYIVMNGDTLTDIDIGLLIGDGWSLESWDFEKNVFIGTKYVHQGFYLPDRQWDFYCYWQDIGTPTGLRKARRDYGKKGLNKKKTHHLPKL